MDRSLVDQLPPMPTTFEIQRVAELLRIEQPVRVVDVGANPIDGEPPYQLLLRSGLAQVTGFEPQPDALERLQQAAGPAEQYLPHAVGDGTVRSLYHCASEGFTSTLRPDPAQLAVLTDFPALAGVERTTEVSTVRLDDVPELGRVDLLKMDVQGGEGAILNGATTALRQAVAVQTEVGFHRLYEDAPTFAEIDLLLRKLGLVPHSFVSVRTWPMAPVEWADPVEVRSRQLVEADMLYVVDPVGFQGLSTDRLQRMGLIAYGGYGAAGITMRALVELASRGVVPQEAVQFYRDLVAEHLTEPPS